MLKEDDRDRGSLAIRPYDGGGESSPETSPEVEEAVQYINACTLRNGPAQALEVGDYVLAAFFDGDYERFSDPGLERPSSFRALLARPDLRLGAGTVYAFVRVSRQLRQLPYDVAQRLTVSHHCALLPLRDRELKAKLARRAVDEAWSPSRLQGEVRRRLTGVAVEGDPSPSEVEAIRRMIRTLEEVSGLAVTTDQLEEKGTEELHRLAGRVDGVLRRLDELRDALEELQTPSDGVTARASPDLLN